MCQQSSPPRYVFSPWHWAWLIGVTYAVGVGWSLDLAGLQATILWILLLVALFHQFRGVELPTGQRLFLGFGLLNAASYTVNSNYRLLALNLLCLTFIATYMLATLARGNQTPAGPGEYARLLPALLRGIGANIFKLETWSALLPQNPLRLWHRPSPDFGRGALLSAALLIFFHLLLAQVNDPYRGFVAALVNQIWQVLCFIWDLELLWMALQAFLIAGLVQAVLQVRLPDINLARGRQPPTKTFLVMVLVPILMLLAVFSIFQGPLLFQGLQELSYLELSRYTRQGFAELLVVAITGGLLWHYLGSTAPSSRPRQIVAPVLLLTFAVELLLLTLFSQHKLAVQQSLFGFRDQRVFASSGVLLLTISFAVCGYSILRPVATRSLFAIQYGSLFVIVGLFSVINLEQTMQDTNPIRFIHEEQFHPDLAYLLTNSFDNYSSWLSVMDEEEQRGMPMPSGYYWGVYRSLCQSDFQRYGTNQTLLRAQRHYLMQRYAVIPKPRRLRHYLRFNWREYQAYRVYRDNPERVERFISFVETECNRVG